MPDAQPGTYPPINTLKPVVENLWIVDGPIIRFGMPWPKMPFPTRMTVIRLADGGLFLHSPTALVPEFRAQIEALGPPRWIIGPNRIHYWWLPDWQQAFPHAITYLAPGIREHAKRPLDFAFRRLEADHGYPWDDEIATLPVRGSYMTEFVFLHRPSRTLILTDLIENFERSKMRSPLQRWLTRIAGAQDPDGSMPRDMRLTFARHRSELKAAVERMIEWNPARIILAHGRWYEKNGAAELQRAFRWLLPSR